MIIALLTDFGLKDYFVGAMKGVISSISETAKIVDITHEIEPQNVRAASFTLRACFENFPPKTIFVAVVDPGVGSNRRAILVETTDYFFVSPDNGLLNFIFDESGKRVESRESRVLSQRNFRSRLTTRDSRLAFRVFEIANEKYFAENVSRTFHGRDIFAPVAAHLANGVAPAEFGGEIGDYVCTKETRPRKISPSETRAEIIHIDRFGNLITNLRRENLPRKFIVRIGETRIERLLNFFAEAEEGEVFMIFGSAGFLEIAAFKQSAQSILDVRAGQKIIARIS